MTQPMSEGQDDEASAKDLTRPGTDFCAAQTARQHS
jgi:hypothetical protein